MTAATDESMTGAEKVKRLAEGYLESFQQQETTESREAVEERLADAKERRNNLAAKHGQDHSLVEKATDHINDLKSEIEDIEASTATVDENRNDLLEAIIDDPGFDLAEPWLNPTVIRAVTHALYGEEDTSFVLHAEEIQDGEDVEELEELDRLEMASVVVQLAHDRLDEYEDVHDRWQRLSDSKKYPAFEVVVDGGALHLEDIAAEIEDASQDKVSNWLKNPINHWDEFIPYYRPQQGVYGLSTSGRYFADHFADVDSEEVAAPEKSEEEESDGRDEAASYESVSVESENEGSGDVENSESKQTRIGNAFTPTEVDEESTEADSETTAEPETIEEKADRMFSNVGESGDDD